MSMNQKIYKAIQKGLNEALGNLSTNGFVISRSLYENNHKPTILEQNSKKLLIDRFVNRQEIDETAEVKKLKQFINSHPNVNIGIIKANNKNHLKKLINDGVKFLGNHANLNWIDTSGINNMSKLFWRSGFDGDISNWDVSNVYTMEGMFMDSQFNGDISYWDVSNVTHMALMFAGSQFNGDISNWDISNVCFMNNMFMDSQFDSDISDWDLIDIDDDLMFDNCPIKDYHKPLQ